MKQHNPNTSPITGEPITASTEWSEESRQLRVEYDDHGARYCTLTSDGWAVLQTAPGRGGKYDLTRAAPQFRAVFRALFAANLPKTVRRQVYSEGMMAAARTARYPSAA